MNHNLIVSLKKPVKSLPIKIIAIEVWIVDVVIQKLNGLFQLLIIVGVLLTIFVLVLLFLTKYFNEIIIILNYILIPVVLLFLTYFLSVNVQQSQIARLAHSQNSKPRSYNLIAKITTNPTVIYKNQFSSPSYFIRAKAGIAEVDFNSKFLIRKSKLVAVKIVTNKHNWKKIQTGGWYYFRSNLKQDNSSNLIAAICLPKSRPILVQSPNIVFSKTEYLRNQFYNNALNVLPVSLAGLLFGLILGDTSGLGAKTYLDFKQSGLLHLMAVSGANITILFLFIRFFLLLIGMSPKIQTFILLGLLGVFVFLVQPTPSVLRAALMSTITLLTLIIQRPQIGLTSLSLAVIILLFIQPELAWDYGFLLSVTATFGILKYSPMITEITKKWIINFELANLIAISIAANVATLLVQLLMHQKVNIGVVLANVLVEPVIAVLTILGVTAFISMSLKTISQVCLSANMLELLWLEKVAAVFAHLPQISPWVLLGMFVLFFYKSKFF